MRRRYGSLWFGARRSATAVLTVAISLVVSAPIWHHGHHPLELRSAAGQDHDHRLHLCATGGHGLPRIGCAVCFSQRLLDHSRPEAATVVATPTSSTRLQTERCVRIGLSVARDERARAPPAA